MGCQKKSFFSKKWILAIDGSILFFKLERNPVFAKNWVFLLFSKPL